MLQKSAIALVFTVLALSACVRPPGYHRAVVYYQHGDYAAAFRAFRPIAEQGYAKAQYTLGLMYDMGQGVPQDYGEAMKWFREAAEQGDAIAQSILGIMYRDGQGAPQDYTEAHKWFNLSVVEGDAAWATTTQLRDAVAALMTPGQIAEAQRLAREWKPKKKPPVSERTSQ